jgi:hypothetical protein
MTRPAWLPTPTDLMTTTTHVAIGTEVSYTDVANPRQAGWVTEIALSAWGIQYKVRWNTDGHTREQWTDLRQHGWTINGTTGGLRDQPGDLSLR